MEKVCFFICSRDSTKLAVIRDKSRKFGFYSVLNFNRIFAEVKYDRKQACRHHVVYRIKRRVG